MLGDKIKKLRMTKGMTQKQLANELNIAQSTVGMIERNTRGAGNDLLIKLSKYFDVSLDFLLNTEEKLDMTIESLDEISKLCKEGLEQYTLKENRLKTIVTQFENEEFTDNDLESIENFIKFIVSKNKK